MPFVPPQVATEDDLARHVVASECIWLADKDGPVQAVGIVSYDCPAGTFTTIDTRTGERYTHARDGLYAYWLDAVEA
jgi:hypothetical protein